jgi:hypothetical protein
MAGRGGKRMRDTGKTEGQSTDVEFEFAWQGTPSGPEISGAAGKFVPVVGREPLKPAPGTDVVARFADGTAALTRHPHGKDQVWVAGFFPGLEYSAGLRSEEFDMTRDFDALRRSFIAAPALERTKPVVDASQPLVEGVLLRHEATGKRAVTLMNWAYRVSGKKISGKKTSTLKALVPFKDLRIFIRGDAKSATSTVLGRALTVERSGDGVMILLPEVREGDVLCLD